MSVDHEKLLDFLAADLDHSHPAAPKSVRGAKAFPTGFGAGVTAVIRLLLAAGIPWLTIITKLWSVVVADRAAGKGVIEIAQDIIARWLTGEFGPLPPGVAP